VLDSLITLTRSHSRQGDTQTRLLSPTTPRSSSTEVTLGAPTPPPTNRSTRPVNVVRLRSAGRPPRRPTPTRTRPTRTRQRTPRHADLKQVTRAEHGRCRKRLRERLRFDRSSGARTRRSATRNRRARSRARRTRMGRTFLPSNFFHGFGRTSGTYPLRRSRGTTKANCRTPILTLPVDVDLPRDRTLGLSQRWGDSAG
jgi:hypothetical protein